MYLLIVLFYDLKQVGLLINNFLKSCFLFVIHCHGELVNKELVVDDFFCENHSLKD